MRRFITLVALLALMSLTATAAAAHDSQTHGWVRIYEDTGLGGDSILITLDDPDFEFGYPGAHTQPGLCNAPVNNDDDWNDCMSSATIFLAAGHCVQLFNGANYTQSMRTFRSGDDGSYNFTGAGQGDSLTSIRFFEGPTC